MNSSTIPSPTSIRKTIIEMLHRSKASHLGSNMSVVEMQIGMLASVNITKIKNQLKL